jgi:thiopeptide-type bacteriocin biosynthesis protein
VAERVFHADSEAVVAALAALPSDDDAYLRWRVALVGVDRLLGDLGLSVVERQAAVRAWRDGLAAEQPDRGSSARQHTGKVMRRERAELSAVLDGVPPAGPLAGAVAAFERRSAAMAPVLADLREAERDGRLEGDVVAIANSYSHMHVNRLLRADQRVQELLLYDLLDRLYSVRIHKEGQT